MPISAAGSRHHARVAALSRSRTADDPDMIAARRDLAEAKLSAYIAQVLAEAPPLSIEQRTRLAELLAPVRRGGEAQK